MIFKPLAGLPFIAPPNTAIHCPDATIIHPHLPIICSPLASLHPVVHATWTRIPTLNLALLTSANPRHSTSPTGDAHCSPGIFHSASGIIRHLVSCHSLPASRVSTQAGPSFPGPPLYCSVRHVPALRFPSAAASFTAPGAPLPVTPTFTSPILP